jgi:hypothetical protein
MLLSPTLLQAQAPKNSDIEVSGAVLATAEWANFKYMDKLEAAKKRDHRALKELFEFSGTVDGKEAIQHTTTLLELIPFVTDDLNGTIISNTLKPKLKTVLLERFQKAQELTKKEDLQKPLETWAPMTWRALNGEKVMCSSCLKEGGEVLGKPGAQKPNAPNAPQAQEQTTTTSGN